MGQFQEYEVKKLPKKEVPRSRIPRMVPRLLRLKEKELRLVESPFSEEESRDGDTSARSKVTLSTNSFCSDDTGCPSSHSLSPSKTSSGSENSPLASPLLGGRAVKVKRVRLDGGTDRTKPQPRLKKEQRSPTQPRGSEVDFSSSSSTGSLKIRESGSCYSSGKKAPSRSRGAPVRSLPVFKPAGSPSAARDAHLYTPCRATPKATAAAVSSTNSSCNSSPTSRRAAVGRYHSCGDNHGIKPPNPEQYLTPLQQKEVAIRHLRSQLVQSERRVHERESEMDELKGQLRRMREDWIEEECRRVEAQLALKEARREIKQLRQVGETMKGSLLMKDKGIQKYFVDITIQNRKLESLLHSMEVAQNGPALQDEPTLDFICDPSAKGSLDSGVDLEDQPVEEMADGGLLAADEADVMESIVMSAAVDSSQVSKGKPGPKLGMSSLVRGVMEEDNEPPSLTVSSTGKWMVPEEKSVQTDIESYIPDLQSLLLQLLKLHGNGIGESIVPTSRQLPEDHANQVRPTYYTPISSTSPPLESPDCSSDVGSEPAVGPRFMEELDFGQIDDTPPRPAPATALKRYWSGGHLADLATVAAPALPALAWLYTRHGVDGNAPVQGVASLLRGCYVAGLRSLRHVP